MDSTVLTLITAFGTALLSGGVTLAVCIINNVAQNSKQKAEMEKLILKIQADNDKKTDIMKLEITSLKDAVEKHNSVVERTTRLESLVVLIEERLKNMQEELKRFERNIDDIK